VIFALWLLPAVLIMQSESSISSGRVDQEAISKDCAMNVANINGNVTIQNCPGVPIKALNTLNRELKARRLSEAQAKRSAEEWREKYESLQSQMASAGLSVALLKKALAFLESGDLAAASKVLDEAAKDQDQAILQAATIHFYRGKVAELQFDYDVERAEFKAAYLLAPHSVMIANDYGIFLSHFGPLSESDQVFRTLLSEATAANALALQAATLINDAGTLLFQGRFAEATEDYLNAASLWATCYKAHEANSLNNEAAAFSGAAKAAFAQQRFEEGKGFINRAISLYEASLKSANELSGSQNRLSLGRAFLISGDLELASGHLDFANSKYEQAKNFAENSFPDDLADQAKVISGDAQSSECYISARRGLLGKARAECDSALAALDPMRGRSGNKYNGDLAQALFIDGLVREDQREWSEALHSFQQAESLWDSLVQLGESQFGLDRAKASFYSIGAAFNCRNKELTIHNARHAVLLSEGLSPAYVEFHKLVLSEAAAAMEGFGERTEATDTIAKRELLGP
jgi:Tfp pilus assembly protein PilF